MGSGSSFLFCGEEDDEVLGVEFDNSQGVIKRIPIEVKPRGKLGLRSVRSLSKPKNESLRSALSVDLEHPDAEKIRKEFDLYRLNKENEMVNMKKKQQKLETENRKLRAELQTMQKTCKKQKQERDTALEAEHRAMMRAAAIESDRDKIQRQFKIFRETKESELQNLLRAKRELESRLAKVGSSLLEDMENTSRLEATADWWMALESEPSLASSNPLVHSSVYRGPEFAQSMLELDGPYVNINKDDWHAACSGMMHSYPIIPDSLSSNLLIVYFSLPQHMQSYLDNFLQAQMRRFEQMCAFDGRSLLMVNMHTSCKDTSLSEVEMLRYRYQQISRCSIFIILRGQENDRTVERDVEYFQRCTTGKRPCLYFTLDHSNESDMQVDGILSAKGIPCSSSEDFCSLLSVELERLLKDVFAISGSNNDCVDDFGSGLDEPLLKWGTHMWDSCGDTEQMEALCMWNQSTCQLGFEKHYDRLNEHVSAAGPVPPLLVSGKPGVGKSLLLAKWIELQQYRTASCLVLYHFVGCHSSSSADPVLMIRRLTARLMQHVVSPPPLSSDPARLIEEFPKWLEKVSSKIPGGIVLVLDSIDRLQKCDTLLSWLTDPLPVDLRVIVSADEDRCLQAWKLWPSLKLEALSQKNVKDLFYAQLTNASVDISHDIESIVLRHCSTDSTCHPLYVVLITAYIARCHENGREPSHLTTLLKSENVQQLYIAFLEALVLELDESATVFLRKALLLVALSRNGISEQELFHVLPDLTWNVWAQLCSSLLNLHFLTYSSGILVFKHAVVHEAVQSYCLAFDNNQELTVKNLRILLKNYHAQFTLFNEVTCRTADELPYQCRQLNDKDDLKKALLNLCIFVKLYSRGHYSELISNWQFVGLEKQRVAGDYMTAVGQLEDSVNDNHGTVSLTTVADVYEGLGQFFRDWSLPTEALASLQRALEIRETELDPDHPCIARNLHLLGDLHLQSNKSMTAESLYKQSLEIYRSALGDQHPLVARELDTLAALYQKQGKHEMSEPLHKLAAAIRKANGVSLALSNCKLSTELRTRAGQLTGHLETVESARTLNELGVLCYLQNNVHAAETLFQRALEIRESLLKPSHPDIAQSLNNLAALYNDRKEFDKAAPLYERALDIRKKNFTIEHPGVVSILKNLGILYKKTGQLSKAEMCYRGLVEGKENSFGFNHPSVATALVNLAVLCSQQCKYAEAEPMYERALSIYEESLDPCHPRVCETLRNMALLKYEQGDMMTAAKLYKRASEIKDAESSCNDKPESHRSLSLGGDQTTTIPIRGLHPVR